MSEVKPSELETNTAIDSDQGRFFKIENAIWEGMHPHCRDCTEYVFDYSDRSSRKDHLIRNGFTVIPEASDVYFSTVVILSVPYKEEVK